MRPTVAALLVLAAVPHCVLAQNVIPELPGAGRPVDIEFTRARRERLLQLLGNAVVAIPAAEERSLEKDVLQDNDFRQDDYFFYLTGLETAGAWLVLAGGGAEHVTVLLLPPRDTSQERWTGIRLGPGPDAVRLSGINDVVPVASLDSVLTALRRRFPAPFYAPFYQSNRDNDQLKDWEFSGRDVRNVVPVMDSMRVSKDSAELARLRRAIDITTQAERAAMRTVTPGEWEYQLEATVEYTFRNLGADRLGFPSIIGSGPNSTTFHYDLSRRQMQAGETVVVDVGAEYGQYTADVTRTMPVSGKFTQRQKAIYDLVLATQQAAMDSARPGVTIRDLNRVARTYMKSHSGSLCGDKTCDEYFSHGLSHHLGMRVHDVGDLSMALPVGAVITIEPGIYLPAENFGVRIEDDILLTPQGYQLLSSGAPRTTADIEAAMREREPAKRAQAGR